MTTAHVLLLALSYLLPFQQKETLGVFIPVALASAGPSSGG